MEELLGINYILLTVLIGYIIYKFDSQQHQIAELKREVEEMKQKQ